MDEQELNMSLNDKLWDWLGEKPKGDFTTDLSLCFERLVPKIVEKLADIDLSSTEEAIYKLFDLWVKEFTTRLDDTPALALCLVIIKLIEKGIEKLIDKRGIGWQRKSWR